MIKRGWGLLLGLLLCLMACGALADDYGTAVIDGRDSYKVHLREAPSSGSESKGVFFTGTEVTLVTDPREEWVHVKIGYLYGYMKSSYLRRGEAADRVGRAYWRGTVDATRYARMRYGPSTEYQFARNVNDGEDLIIMGETDNHWYYVAYRGEEGYISANLIYTSGQVIEEKGQAAREEEQPLVEFITPAPVSTWKTAYREYILANYHEAMTYGLIYVDRDSIPELVIHTGGEAGGCQILTWHNGMTDVLQTRRLGFTYQERGNLLCNSDGHMGYYYDDVFEIRNGKWKLLAYGAYDNPEGWDEEQGRYVCNHYVFSGKEVTESEYLRALDAIYPRWNAEYAENLTDLPGIITLLRE